MGDGAGFILIGSSTLLTLILIHLINYYLYQLSFNPSHTSSQTDKNPNSKPPNHYNYIKYFPYNQNHLTIIKSQTQKMKKMSTTRRLSVKQLPIQHCKDDIACLHCCSCWQKHKKQFDIKLDMWMRKSEESRKEVEFLTRLNKELMGQLNGCKLRLKKLGNIQEIKQQFRKQIYQQVMKQREIEDQITAQKLQTLQQSLESTLQSLHTLQQSHQQITNRLQQIQHELQQSQQQNLVYKQQNNQLKQQINEIQQKTLELYDVIKKYQNRVDQKQAVIQQLRVSVGELEGKFMVERAKAYSVGADKDMLEVNLKNKEQYIESLTKCSQQNLKNLNNLQFTNTELKKLVNNLDYEVTAGRYNQNYFKDRLLSSQHQLALTEGLARYHSQKVQLMKGDLQLLKLTI